MSMHALLIMFLIACPGLAQAGEIEVQVSTEPVHYAWWLRLTFTPTHTQIRGIPVKDLKKSWRRASELKKEYLPRDLLYEDGADLMDQSQIAFSVASDFKHDGRTEEALVGVYEADSGERGSFLLIAKWATSLERHFARYLAGEVSYQGQRRDRVREMVDPSLSDETADRIFAGYLASYEAGWSLFSDVLPCLDSLAQHRLGVISNGQGVQQRRKLAQTGIVDRFECVVISEECGCAKPDPTIFLRACAEAGESPANSVYGDRYDLDAQAARTAGLRGIWLDRKEGATAEHVSPIIRSLDRLGALLIGAKTLPNKALQLTPGSGRG